MVQPVYLQEYRNYGTPYTPWSTVTMVHPVYLQEYRNYGPFCIPARIP